MSRVDPEANLEPQRDQSDSLSAPMALNDVHDPVGLEQRLSEQSGAGSKVQDTSKDYLPSTRSSRAESSSSGGPWDGQPLDPNRRDELDYVQVDDEGLTNVVEHGDAEADGFVLEKHGEDSPGTTVTSIREAIATEAEARPIEQKNVEDIRAISFQVPSPVDESDGRQEANRHPGDEEAGKLAESRKDHSRPVNNLLLGGGKSTKAFYEIKPSIKTEMENDRDQQPPSSTQRSLAGRKFVLPSVDSAFGKFGPYFEDGDQEINITARIGSTMLLDCKIGMLSDKKVSFCSCGVFRFSAVSCELEV